MELKNVTGSLQEGNEESWRGWGKKSQLKEKITLSAYNIEKALAWSLVPKVVAILVNNLLMKGCQISQVCWVE